MTILNPKRNETPQLWWRLEASSMMPILLVGATIGAMNLATHDKVVAIVLLAMLVVIAIVSALNHRRLVRKLKARYEHDSNKPVEGTR